jgi:two-component system, response regulator RegA
MKILLVDDDRDQLTIRCMLLSHHGFETLRASGVTDALRIAAAQQPDCAIVDVRLPTEEAGLALIRELKALVARITIFVLTGADPGHLEHQPERKLIDELIAKGSPSKPLIERLKQLAAQRAA